MARISLLGGLFRLGTAFCVAAPLGGIIMGVGDGISTVLRTPQMVFHSYVNLWKTESLGPVAKIVTGLVLPVPIVVAPAFATLGSVIAGVAYFGFWRGLTETSDNDTFLHVPFTGAAESFKAVIDFDEAAAKFAWIEARKLKEGDEPYEIRIIEGVRGLLSAAIVTPFQAIGLTAVTLAYWPKGVYRMHQSIWEDADSSLTILEGVLKVAIEIIGLVCAVIAIPLTPIGSMVFSIIDTCVEGYKRGVRSAFGNAAKRINDWRKSLKALVSKDMPPTDSDTRATCTA